MLSVLPGTDCAPEIANYHHACPAHDGANTGIKLEEYGRLNPEMQVMDEEDPSRRYVAAGLFYFWWKEGKCADCGFHVRSGGRLDLAENHSPAQEPKVARQAASRPGNPGQPGP
jgi:hypothetical protein